MTAAKKVVRPGLSREQILTPGLPAASPAPADPPPPAPYPGIRGYGQNRPATTRTRAAAKRADPPGMKRESYYVTQASADAIEAAVAQILTTLGGKTPKQVILSALLHAGAERATEVAARIATEQANELTAQLDALRRAAG